MKLVRILLPIDLNGTTEACARIGFGLAERFGVELEVLLPCPPPMQRMPYATELSPVYFTELMDVGAKQAEFEKRQGKQWLEATVPRFPKVKAEILSLDDIAGPAVAMRAKVSDLTVLPSIAAKEEEFWDGAPHESDKYGGWSKRIGEIWCQANRDQRGLNYVTVRPTNTYGPWDNFDPVTGMVVGALIGRAAKGENPLKPWGRPDVKRDLLYSDDCARGMILAVEKGRIGEAYNLGMGKATAMGDVAAAASQYAGKGSFEFDDSKPAGPNIRLMDITKAREELGFDPQVNAWDGIQITAEWYKANQGYKKWSAFK